MTIKQFKSGELLRANRLNQLVDAANGVLSGARQVDKPPPQDQNPYTPDVVDEIWTQVDSETTTIRVEDADDSDTYVDVVRVDSVSMQKPDGTVIQLKFTY